MSVATFDESLAEIRRACAWEYVPHAEISALAPQCGPAEVERLIRDLDALDDADLVGDAGDVADEYWRLRTAYSQLLAEAGEVAVEPLLRALGSANVKTRGYAARALGRMREPRAFEPIAALLAREGPDGAGLSFIEALGELGDPRAIDILVPYLRPLEQANRGWVVRIAAGALGRIGTETVIGPLAEVLATEPDWFGRLGAVEGLRHIRHPRAQEVLQAALNDPDDRVKAEARAALAEQ